MSSATPVPWDDFSQDPRRPELGRRDLVAEELRRLEAQQRKARDDRRSGS